MIHIQNVTTTAVIVHWIRIGLGASIPAPSSAYMMLPKTSPPNTVITIRQMALRGWVARATKLGCLQPQIVPIITCVGITLITE